MNGKSTLIAILLAIALLIGAPSQAQVRSMTLNAPAPGDLHADTLTEPPAMPLANERRETVSLSWVASVLNASAERSPFEAISRSFTQRVSAKAFARGVTIVTDAPGAVLRVSASRGQLDAQRLYLSTGGSRQALGALSDQLVNTDDLRAAGMAGPATVVGAALPR